MTRPPLWPSIDHSLISPSGRMSKRARAAAQAREAARLFPPGSDYLTPVPPTQPSPAERKRRAGQNLLDLAARGMKVRAYEKAGRRLMAEADALEPGQYEVYAVDSGLEASAAHWGRPLEGRYYTTFAAAQLDADDMVRYHKRPFRVRIPREA